MVRRGSKESGKVCFGFQCAIKYKAKDKWLEERVEPERDTCSPLGWKIERSVLFQSFLCLRQSCSITL